MPFRFSYNLQTFRGDVFGGITAAVVGLPVALAFGVASGLGALAGIYGAIAVGFFAAVFGGTKSQISGPTGPMAVAMAVIVTTHANNLAEAFTVVIMAGLIQILLGVMKVGRFVSFTPYSVISGFMSGIGVIIILLQTLPFLGASVVMGGPMSAVRSCRSGHEGRQPQRVCHRRRHPCRGYTVAGQATQGTASHPGGAYRRHNVGRFLAHQHARHW